MRVAVSHASCSSLRGMGTALGSDLLDRLASAAILPQLVTLDLSRGWMPEREILEPYAERFAHLTLVPPDERFIPVYE